MKKRGKIVILIIVILLFSVSSFFLNKSLTGQAIKEDNKISSNKSEIYIYTKAICNESNFCQDNKITCKGNEAIGVVPITGAAMQFDEDWEDPRTKDEREKLC